CRNQLRNFNFELNTTGTYVPIPRTCGNLFNVLAVNVEENSRRSPVNYLIPPGIERVQQLSNNGINLLQNEQAMSFQIRDMPYSSARGSFKTMNLDMRQYGRLSMFLHAESVKGMTAIADTQLQAVIRIGTDF